MTTAEQYGAIHFDEIKSRIAIWRNNEGFRKGCMMEFAQEELKLRPTAPVHRHVFKYWPRPSEYVAKNNQFWSSQDDQPFFYYFSRRSRGNAFGIKNWNYCDYTFNPVSLANIIYLANFCVAEQNDLHYTSRNFIQAVPTTHKRYEDVQHVFFNFGKKGLLPKKRKPKVDYKTPAQVAHQFACFVSEQGFSVVKVKGSKVYIRPKLKDDNFEYHWIDSL